MLKNENIIEHKHDISKLKRSELKNQKPCIIWFTGLSGSGKSTIANALEVKLHELHIHTYLLDGDNIRLGLNKGLGFSQEDRVENIRRVGEVAKLFVDAGLIVLTAFISPFQKERDTIRLLVENDEFIEVFVDTPLEVCENRDPKGLYKKARSGELSSFTGISAIYETPSSAEVILKTYEENIIESVEKIINYLQIKGYIYHSQNDVEYKI